LEGTSSLCGGGKAINVAGQKVYSAEVEQAILELDNIRDVVVYGEANPFLGQIVVAKVATLEPESAVSLKQRIRRGCARWRPEPAVKVKTA
jgi:acyl-coenzyme A synthetase/AMP-(fatty) acid ligase